MWVGGWVVTLTGANIAPCFCVPEHTAIPGTPSWPDGRKGAQIIGPKRGRKGRFGGIFRVWRGSCAAGTVGLRQPAAAVARQPAARRCGATPAEHTRLAA